MTALDSRAPSARPDPPTPDPPAIASERLRAQRVARRSVGWLAIVLPPVLVGYALLDRGFAYLHVPGTPIFAGEVVVLVCVAGAVVGTGYIHRSVEHSIVAKLILLFAAWGLVRTVPYLRADGFD